MVGSNCLVPSGGGRSTAAGVGFRCVLRGCRLLVASRTTRCTSSLFALVAASVVVARSLCSATCLRSARCLVGALSRRLGWGRLVVVVVVVLGEGLAPWAAVFPWLVPCCCVRVWWVVAAWARAVLVRRLAWCQWVAEAPVGWCSGVVVGRRPLVLPMCSLPARLAGCGTGSMCWAPGSGMVPQGFVVVVPWRVCGVRASSTRLGSDHPGRGTPRYRAAFPVLGCGWCWRLPHVHWLLARLLVRVGRP